MNIRKLLALAFLGSLLVGCLAWRTITARQSQASPLGAVSPEAADAPLSMDADYGGVDSNITNEERFKPYEPFGLTYDSGKEELQYEGKAVRWFQDYYEVADGLAGNDFFNENGVVDVYAVREFSNLAHSDDGSFDPSGKLVGVKKFSEEEFASRDLEAIKNPPPPVAIAGEPPSSQELEDMAKEYEPFGLTYSTRQNQWYLNGEEVLFLWDVLASNGESLTGGSFHGAIRSLESAGGAIGVYTIRDFSNPNSSGNGTLTGVKKFSQKEFDEHRKLD